MVVKLSGERTQDCIVGLQVTETSPVAYDAAVRITMTWMTENMNNKKELCQHKTSSML